MNHKALAALVTLSLASTSALAVVVAGQVTDAATNAYVPFARLQYTVGTTKTITATDKRGKFSIDVPAGTTIRADRRDYVLKSFTTPLAATQPLSKATAPAGFVMVDTFDTLIPGLQTDRDRFVAMQNTNSANGFIKDGDPEQTTNRITVDTSTYIGSSGNSVKIMYPPNLADAKPSGAQWWSRFATPATDLYVSYWVKPGASHDFGKGGKLPGLGGDLTGDPKEVEWSGKLMWRTVGAVKAGLEFYIHSPGTAKETSYLWNLTGTHAELIKGQWNHIQIHYKLNTPGVANGLIEGWLNGVKRGEVKNIKILNTGNVAKIDYFFFSTFYGGDNTYAPATTQYMWFDDVRVSTSFQTYNASTPMK